jgi:hypothetical protein
METTCFSETPVDLYGVISQYATNLEVACLIPDKATNFFKLPNPSSSAGALDFTQTPTEISTRNLSGGKGATYV